MSLGLVQGCDWRRQIFGEAPCSTFFSHTAAYIFSRRAKAQSWSRCQGIPTGQAGCQVSSVCLASHSCTLNISIV